MLELHRLGYRYRSQPWLLRGVDLDVAPGEAVALLAPNGRGKSTLLRCAAGLLRPEEGTVSRPPVFAYLPQAHQVVFGFSVLDMVLMGRARHVGLFSTPGPSDCLAATAALERVGLAHLAERAYPSLSGGEQQLVLIARALASEARLLLLDEPASALDLANQSLVLNMLGDLAAEGFAVLFSTHEPDHAEAVANRVALLYGPGELRVGPTAGLLTAARLSELYGLPVRRRSFTFPAPRAERA